MKAYTLGAERKFEDFIATRWSSAEYHRRKNRLKRARRKLRGK